MANLRPETKARIEQTGPADAQPRSISRPAATSSASPRTTRPAATSARCCYDLDVPDFVKAPFSISGLVLTSPSGAAMPTVARRRAAQGGAAGVRRSRCGRSRRTTRSRCSPRSTTTPAARRTKSTSPRRSRRTRARCCSRPTRTRDSSDLGGKRGGYGYTTKIPLKDLAPGSYVLKVEAKSRLANTPPVVARSAVQGRTARARERPR